MARNKRAEYIYGKKGGPLSFPKWTAEDEDKIFKKSTQNNNLEPKKGGN